MALGRTQVFLDSARKINANSARRSATTVTHWAPVLNPKMPFILHKSATPRTNWVFATAASMSKILIHLKDHLHQHKHPLNRKNKTASRRKARRRAANPALNWCSILTSEVDFYKKICAYFSTNFSLFSNLQVEFEGLFKIKKVKCFRPVSISVLYLK